MPEETKEILADVVAKSLEEAVPCAVEAAMDVKLKELSLSDNPDIKEMKSQMKELVEKSRIWTWDDLAKLQKEFVKALKVLKEWDLNAIKAMNTLNPADWWYLVHPEFEKWVYRIMEKYWIWKDCDISRMNSNTKYFILRKSWLQVFYTDEAAAFSDTTLQYERKEMIAKKIWAILNVTYELIEDEADADEIWNKAQEEFAQAFAYFLDKEILLWTWVGTDNSNMVWIANLNNVNVVSLSWWVSSLNHDALIDAVRKVPLKYKQHYKPSWFMSQDAIAVIEKLKDEDWRPLYRTLDNWEKWYLLWYPVILTDVMPSWAIEVDTPFIAFGSLRYYALWIKRWFTFEFGYRAWGWEKDVSSLKASARVCWLALSEDAFSVIKTAASASSASEDSDDTTSWSNTENGWEGSGE